MRRRNLKQAFVGEGNPNQEGLEVEQEAAEEVEFRVVDGHIAFVVPPGTNDDDVIGAQVYTHAELVLENGVHVTIGIHQATVGAQVGMTRPAEEVEIQPDLSTASEVTQGDAV